MGKTIETIYTILHCTLEDFSVLEYDELIITNERGLVEEFLNDNVRFQLGEIMSNSLLKSPVYVYSKLEDCPADITKIDVIREQSRELRYLLECLWLVKDHAARLNTTVGIALENGRGQCVYSMAPERYTTLDCLIPDTSFSFDDIDAANNYYIKAEDAANEKNNPTRIETIPAPADFLPARQYYTFGGLRNYKYSDYNRIERSLILLSNARQQSYLPFKIAYFIPVLECLFSDSDANSVTHKVAERISYFLTQDFAERRIIFEAVKKAYNIRSKVFHGSTTSADNAQLITICRDIEGIVRKILSKVIGRHVEEFKKENMSDFFVKLMFDKEYAV